MAINMLFELLFARVLASHRGGPGSEFSIDMTLIKSFHNTNIISMALCQLKFGGAWMSCDLCDMLGTGVFCAH
jgi:hypothetical protein